MYLEGRDLGLWRHGEGGLAPGEDAGGPLVARPVLLMYTHHPLQHITLITTMYAMGAVPHGVYFTGSDFWYSSGQFPWSADDFAVILSRN
jgi:hypothetical protein